MSGSKLIAVDPSLTCSGWALFSIKSAELVGVGKIRSLGSSIALPSRLQDLQSKISKLLEGLQLGLNDVLVCEAPTTMKDPRAAFKVEQVRGIFEIIARQRGLNVPGRLNPRSVQYEVMGLNGRQLSRTIIKSTAVQVVEQLYSRSLFRIGFDCSGESLRKNQDIVDAILVGSLGLARIKSSEMTRVPLEQLFLEKGRRGRFKKSVLQS